MPHTHPTALHNVRVNLHREHLTILSEIAVTHGYLENFDLADQETTRLLPTIIRDIIMSYGAIISTDYFKILDKMEELKKEEK